MGPVHGVVKYSVWSNLEDPFITGRHPSQPASDDQPPPGGVDAFEFIGDCHWSLIFARYVRFCFSFMRLIFFINIIDVMLTFVVQKWKRIGQEHDNVCVCVFFFFVVRKSENEVNKTTSSYNSGDPVVHKANAYSVIYLFLNSFI